MPNRTMVGISIGVMMGDDTHWMGCPHNTARGSRIDICGQLGWGELFAAGGNGCRTRNSIGTIEGACARKEGMMAKDRSPKKEVKKPKKAKPEVAKA
jgi:hypothetical protein